MSAQRLVAPLVAFALLALATPAALAADDAPAPGAAAAEGPSAGDRMKQSFRAEAVALRDLAAALKADATAGRLRLTAEAEGRWEQGRALRAEIEALVDAGKLRPAYERLREARELMGSTLMVGLDGGKPSKATRDAFRAYWDTVAPRVDRIVAWGKDHDLTPELAGHLRDGQADWQAAREAAAAGRYREAFTGMLRGLDHLDHVLWTAHADVPE